MDPNESTKNLFSGFATRNQTWFARLECHWLIQSSTWSRQRSLSSFLWLQARSKLELAAWWFFLVFQFTLSSLLGKANQNHSSEQWVSTLQLLLLFLVLSQAKLLQELLTKNCKNYWWWFGLSRRRFSFILIFIFFLLFILIFCKIL